MIRIRAIMVVGMQVWMWMAVIVRMHVPPIVRMHVARIVRMHVARIVRMRVACIVRVRMTPVVRVHVAALLRMRVAVTVRVRAAVTMGMCMAVAVRLRPAVILWMRTAVMVRVHVAVSVRVWVGVNVSLTIGLRVGGAARRCAVGVVRRRIGVPVEVRGALRMVMRHASPLNRAETPRVPSPVSFVHAARSDPTHVVRCLPGWTPGAALHLPAQFAASAHSFIRARVDQRLPIVASS